MASVRPDQLYLLRPPYRLLRPLSSPNRLTRAHAAEAACLIWSMGSDFDEDLFRSVRFRQAGIPLIVIAPPHEELGRNDNLLRVLELGRPVAVMPFHQELSPMDLRTLLREPPESLAASVIDYLTWRGLDLDLDMRRLLRRTIELSGELQTVSGLARGVYMSRRALGRKFLTEGLPVPSHWLHFARLLRAVLRVQTSGESVMTIAYRIGYPDGFAMSNQMKRLADTRPSEVRDRLGWEWFAERWLQCEVRGGGFSEESQQLLENRGAILFEVEGEASNHPPDPSAPARAVRRRQA